MALKKDGDQQQWRRIATLAKDGNRQQWSRNVEFVLAIIGYSVGMGNIWRFPYTCYDSGGGAFLVAYLIMWTLCGVPLLYMELAVGQYTRLGPVGAMSKLCPLLKGITVGSVVLAAIFRMLYMVLLVWPIYYLINSFKENLPWGSCGHLWNTLACFDGKTFLNEANGTDLRNFSTIGALGDNQTVSASAEFFRNHVLQTTSGIDDIGGVRWEFALILLLAWVLIYFAVFKGTKSVGKMTRKKSALWLNAPKRKRSVISTPKIRKFRKTGSPIIKPFISPVSFKKRKATPIKRTPKRHRQIKLNYSSGEEDFDINDDPAQIDILVENEGESGDEIYGVFLSVISKLEKAGKLNDFLTFLNLVENDKFPLDNISFLLFLETVRFFGSSSSKEMWYWPETKRFWKIGRTLFHNKFLYFMGGPKHVGQLLSGETSQLIPSKAIVNFVVPNSNTLSEFRLTDFSIPRKLAPGCLVHILDNIKTDPEDSFMLCADGKKVTAGCDKDGGDVDMFGYEDGELLQERKLNLDLEMGYFDNIKQHLNQRPNELLNSMATVEKKSLGDELTRGIKILGSRIKECRSLKFRQEFGLRKFMSMGGDKWRESRYVYVISSLHASLHQISTFIVKAIELIFKLCKFISILYNSHMAFCSRNYVDPSLQPNMIQLAEQPPDVVLETRYIKQRSDVWFALRKSVKVTGSTLHNALGLRGLKAQKKHFDEFVLKLDAEEVPAEVNRRLSHGTENEKHAVATLVGTVIPVLFPGCHFVEEGCYLKMGQSNEMIAVVSPDGSIRKVETDNREPLVLKDVEAAVEIKCPYPCENQLPVHYSLPTYYVCQCLAEMKVLETKTLLYISYSEKSTTVFEISFDEELWNMIWQEVIDLYDNENPKRLSRARGIVKMLREKINVFVGEFPSLQLQDSGLSHRSQVLPFTYSRDLVQPETDISKTTEEVVIALDECTVSVNDGYSLLRKKATEIMVWVITNRNRNSKLEIPCSVPIAYGLKDYRLTSAAMRNATNHVLSECKKRNIRIDSLATDGQWIQLMVRDENGRPMTVHQLQKDFWKKIKSLKKPELIKKISQLNLVSSSEKSIEDHILISKEGTSIFVESKDIAFLKVRTCMEKKLWSGKKGNEIQVEAKELENVDTSESGEDSIDSDDTLDCDWLPEGLIQSLEENKNSEVKAALITINRALRHSLVNENTNDDTQGIARLDVTEDDDNALDRLYSESVAESTAESTGNSSNNAHVLEKGEEQSDTTETLDNFGRSRDTGDVEVAETTSYTDDIADSSTVNQDESEQDNDYLNVDLELARSILNTLQNHENPKSKWNSVHEMLFKDTLSSEEKISNFTHYEIDRIYEVLKPKLHGTLTTLPEMKKSWKKSKKCDILCTIFGLSKTTNVYLKQVRRKMRSPLPLKKLACNVLRSKKMPKLILCAAYAQYVFPTELKSWQQSSTISSDVKVIGFEQDIPYWYSYPENNKQTEAMLAKSLDCSHNYTHLRVKTSTTGICGVSSEAWKACAKSNQTTLKVPMVMDLLDKQSVPNARTHFSKEVEDWMSKNGFIDAAKLTNLIRSWYEASDSPGISSSERVQKLISFRKRLLEGFNIGKFPPVTCYVKDIPIVTFEGILIDIDTKIQLYGISGAYNIRSVGSLAAETTVGVLQSLNPTSQVSIKAVDVPKLMSNAVELMSCKLNPERGFSMRTSKGSGIYPQHEPSQDESSKEKPVQTKLYDNIELIDHPFDKPERRRAARKIQFGSVSEPNRPTRGALPVRQWHRRDESKILPTKRLGLCE